MGEVSTIGVDVAKSAFQIHGVDADGTASGLPDNVPATRRGRRWRSPGSRAKRLLRMPGSTTTRGAACVLQYRHQPCCLLWDGKHQHPELVLRRSIPRLLPCERFTSALEDNPCITRGQCGSLLLRRDGLLPPTSCRSPGAPVHT